MLLKLCAIFALLKISSALDDAHEWDLAVATNGHVELLAANGTLLGVAREGFSNLKALTFDNVRNQFIVSDMDGYNDTIYAIDLTKETDDNPIIADLPDDVQGLAIDPVDDVLYWTDSKNQTINYISLKDNNTETQVLFTFEEAWPQDIVVDVCRRYIYWTNSNRRKPSIERSKIGSGKNEVIVDTDLGLPAGITIDYETKRIYWADMTGGILFTIESTNLDGKQRIKEYKGINSEPFAVAIKNKYLYFTDLRSNSLWKFDLQAKTKPLKIREFKGKPMGLIANKRQIKTLPECKLVEEAYEHYTVVETSQRLKEGDTVKTEIQCINGTLKNGVCKCSKGYSGVFCELSLCYNYCLEPLAQCKLTSQGYPYCHCPQGSGGPRCEKNCEGYCMNGGRCSFIPGAQERTCSCSEGYKGPRCEESVFMDNLCDFYCSQRDTNNKERDQSYCKCDKRNYSFAEQSPEALLSSEDTSNYINYLEDPVFISLGCIALTALLACMVLVVLVVYLRRKPNPKIKRRYIVNKNSSTSMTERPHAQQCEITIENCCNMNICETPCYEPPRLQRILSSRNEDKKMLLSNMDKVEDY